MTTPPVFLVDRALIESADRVVLEGAEGRHAAKVRRIGAGEEVHLVDGAGLRARCRVQSTRTDGLDLAVLERQVEPTPGPRVVVVQALAKGDRGELAIEMLTEVGADEIVPWSASRSVAQWRGDRAVRSLERWRSIARESAKQARRAHFPTVSALMTTSDVTRLLGTAARGVVLHETTERGLADLVADLPADSPGDVVVVVGPEGGVTDEELASFAAAGATPARLGSTVLRTSTAGVVAVGVILSGTRWSSTGRSTT